MAKFSSVNQLPATGPLAMYSVKTTLVAAGWTVTKSGDGLALYSASGDIITGGGAVAGGLGTTRAYFTITDPSTKVCLSFQTISNTTYRVKYSETGAMAGGSPNSGFSKLLADPPYSFVLHTSPVQERFHRPEYHWHIETRLRIGLREGFEWGTGLFVNPTPPEDAAAYLRGVK